MSKLLKIAQESEEIDAGKTVQVEPGEDAIIITGKDIAIIDAEGDAVADSVEEAEEATEEAEELEEEIEEAEQAVEALEAIAIVLEGAIAKNSLDKAGVKILKIATESIYARLDMPESSSTMAMEAISEHNGGFSAQIALEDMKERIAQIWNAIKVGLTKVVEWIKQFSQKVLGALPTMENRATKLLEASKNVSGTPRTAEVGGGAIVKNLAIGNSVPRGVGAELAKAVAFAREAAAPKITSGITDAVNSVDKGGLEGFVTVAQAVLTAGMRAGSGNEAMGVPSAPEGCETYLSEVLPGNAVVWSHVPASIDDMPGAASGVAVAEVKFGDNVKAATLSPAEIAAVAKAVLSFTALKGEIQALDKAIDRANTMVLRLAGSAKMLRDMDKPGYSLASTEMKNFFGAARAIKALVKGVHQPALAVCARACASGLDYAAASVKAYGAPANLTKQLAAA